MKATWVVGIDEVGRGPLAGPVTVCACGMPLSKYKKMKWHGLTDSKKMSRAAREAWFRKARVLQKKGECLYAVASKSAAHIDKKGINRCISLCIEKALEKINVTVEVIVLLDGGLRAPSAYKNQQTIIRGDSKKKIISLASVIAKVSRDRYMMQQYEKFPAFLWNENKGYGTSAHRKAIANLGITPLHRKTFLKKLLTNDIKYVK